MTLVAPNVTVTPLQMEKTKPDIYGQRHIFETQQLISEKLSLFEAHVAELSEEESIGVQQAEKRCPAIVKSREHRLVFLRSEVFNAKLAAKRFAKYWNKRVELFGEKAFAPLTIEGSLDDEDKIALSSGFAVPMPGKDKSGRGLVWVDASYLDTTKYSRESMIRALMYIEEAVLEDESAQRKGVIFVNYNGNHPTFGQFDRQLIGQWASSTKGCMPIRVSAIYILQIPTLFVVLLNLLKYLLGTRLAKRLLIIPGANDIILKRLEKRGIAKDLLPTEIGGKFVLDQEHWIRERIQAGK